MFLRKRLLTMFSEDHDSHGGSQRGTVREAREWTCPEGLHPSLLLWRDCREEIFRERGLQCHTYGAGTFRRVKDLRCLCPWWQCFMESKEDFSANWMLSVMWSLGMTEPQYGRNMNFLTQWMKVNGWKSPANQKYLPWTSARNKLLLHLRYYTSLNLFTAAV